MILIFPTPDRKVAESKERIRDFLLAESEKMEELATHEADRYNERLLAVTALLQD
jgi:hypothetical protein